MSNCCTCGGLKYMCCWCEEIVKDQIEKTVTRGAHGSEDLEVEAGEGL